jgi:hypothetical protein
MLPLRTDRQTEAIVAIGASRLSQPRTSKNLMLDTCCGKGAIHPLKLQMLGSSPICPQHLLQHQLVIATLENEFIRTSEQF